MSETNKLRTFTLCDLYEALRSLAEAYGYSADVLSGIWAKGLDCKQTIPLDSNVADTLEWLKKNRVHSEFIHNPEDKDFGHNPCEVDPCKIAVVEFGHKLRDFAQRTPDVSIALDQVLGMVEEKEITFLTQPAMPKK